MVRLSGGIITRWSLIGGICSDWLASDVFLEFPSGGYYPRPLQAHNWNTNVERYNLGIDLAHDSLKILYDYLWFEQWSLLLLILSCLSTCANGLAWSLPAPTGCRLHRISISATVLSFMISTLIFRIPMIWRFICTVLCAAHVECRVNDLPRSSERGITGLLPCSILQLSSIDSTARYMFISKMAIPTQSNSSNYELRKPAQIRASGARLRISHICH